MIDYDIKIHPQDEPSPSLLNDVDDVFKEMKAAGVDPEPFIEIIAIDLIRQFGDLSLDYALRIEAILDDDNNTRSALIWKRVADHLAGFRESRILATYQSQTIM